MLKLWVYPAKKQGSIGFDELKLGKTGIYDRPKCDKICSKM